MRIVDREPWEAPDGSTERFAVCPSGEPCDHPGVAHIVFEYPVWADYSEEELATKPPRRPMNAAERKAFDKEALGHAARRFRRTF